MSNWYSKVPKKLTENIEFRKWLIKQCQNSRRRQAVVDACRHDILFYVNAFCFTFDPRKKESILPFVTYKYQDRGFLDVLDCIDTGRDLVIEKSRDMGASWISLLCMEWMWHFQPGKSFLMISRKLDLVDKPGDPRALFWKIDLAHKMMPEWLLPPGYGPDCRKKYHFENPHNFSTIDGEATTQASGVGDRRTAIFLDEFSRMENGASILSGTADTTNCRIINFTPWGTNNAAYKLAKREDIRKLRFHWSEHPEKAAGLYRYSDKTHKLELLDPEYRYDPEFKFIYDNKLRSPWYDAECKRRNNDREIAQHLDIDYQGSAYQFFDRAMINVLQEEYCFPPCWEGDIAFDQESGRPLEFIQRQGGPLKLWLNFINDRPPRGLYGLGCDVSSGTGATNSCGSVINGTSGEKVAQYQSPHLRAEQFAMRMMALGWMFCNEDGVPALLSWEHAGPGAVFGKTVIDCRYGNIFWRENNVMLGTTQHTMPGWYPTTETKILLLEEYRRALSSRECLNRDSAALDECLEFIHTPTGSVEHSGESASEDPSGARGNHGDQVIADALGWKMALTFGKIGTAPKKNPPNKVLPGSIAYRRQQVELETADDGWGR